MRRTNGAALVLAAGRSVRFGDDKRLTPIDNVPMICQTVRKLSSVIDPTVVVTRMNDSIQSVLPDGTQIVEAEHADRGMAYSLRAGMKKVQNSDWVVIALADMPFTRVSTLTRLITFLQETQSCIVRPTFQNQPGNPVGFTSEFYADFEHLEGDQGARTIITQNQSKLILFESNDEGVLLDIDTQQDLRN